MDVPPPSLSRRLMGAAQCTLVVQEKGYVTADVAAEQDLHQLKLSGTKFRQLLRAGENIPDWFAFKSVVDVLRQDVQSSSS